MDQAAEQGTETQELSSEAAQSAADTTKDWEADANKWKALSRKHEAASKAAAEELKQMKASADAGKSEVQQLTDAVKALQERAELAELNGLKAEVAAAKGLTPVQAKRLVGTTREALEEDADELLEAFKPADKKKAAPSNRKEDLRGGGEPSETPQELNPRKLAEAILGK